MPPPVKPNLSMVGAAKMASSSPVPLSQVTFSEEDFKNPTQMVALLNRVVTDHTQVLNQILGYPGGTPSIGANQGVSAAELKAALQEQLQVINQTVASGSTPAPIPSPSALPIPESQIINLIADLAACEKIANKDQPSGYPSLDATTHIPIAEIPVVIHVNGSPVVNVADFNDTTPASDSGYVNAKIRYTGSSVSAEVGLLMPPEFIVSGSPVTPPSSMFAVSKAEESANTVYAGPVSGSPAVPTFRQLSASDLSDGTSGSGAVVKASQPMIAVLIVSGSPAVVTSGQISIGAFTSLTANSTPGGVSLPALAAGYLVINIAGTDYKIPYYAI